MDAISGEKQAPQDEKTLSHQVSILTELARVVRDGNLSELELEHDGVRLRLAAPRAAALPAASGAMESAVGEFYAAPFEETPAATVAPVASTGIEVLSPMVGLFYRAPSPNDPNYIEVGDHVEVGKTLGLVEAMKTYNEITAEVSGTVLEIRAANAALIETGDVLILIQPD
jgi:acetyl-CoA carboxylase biotin carboxyl carrier protein